MDSQRYCKKAAGYTESLAMHRNLYLNILFWYMLLETININIAVKKLIDFFILVKLF